MIRRICINCEKETPDIPCLYCGKETFVYDCDQCTLRIKHSHNGSVEDFQEGGKQTREDELDCPDRLPYDRCAKHYIKDGDRHDRIKGALTPLGEALQAKCSRCNQRWITHDCSVITGQPAGECYHFYRFLDFLGTRKDTGTFYCQKCLKIEKRKL